MHLKLVGTATFLFCLFYSKGFKNSVLQLLLWPCSLLHVVILWNCSLLTTPSYTRRIYNSPWKKVYIYIYIYNIYIYIIYIYIYIYIYIIYIYIYIIYIYIYNLAKITQELFYHVSHNLQLKYIILGHPSLFHPCHLQN